MGTWFLPTDELVEFLESVDFPEQRIESALASRASNFTLFIGAIALGPYARDQKIADCSYIADKLNTNPDIPSSGKVIINRRLKQLETNCFNEALFRGGSNELYDEISMLRLEAKRAMPRVTADQKLEKLAYQANRHLRLSRVLDLHLELEKMKTNRGSTI